MNSPEFRGYQGERATQREINRLCRSLADGLERLGIPPTGEQVGQYRGLPISVTGMVRSVELDGEQLRNYTPEAFMRLRIGQLVSLHHTAEHFTIQPANGFHEFVREQCQFGVERRAGDEFAAEWFGFIATREPGVWRFERSLENILPNLAQLESGESHAPETVEVAEPLRVEECTALQSIVDNLPRLVS